MSRNFGVSLGLSNNIIVLGVAVKRLIRVELKDGSTCRMVKKAFDLFLSQNKVAKFERSDGWVTVGKDVLRAMTESKNYNSHERRCAV